LLQPQHAPDRRGAGAVLSGNGAAGDGPRTRMARTGIADPGRTGAETGARGRRLFRAVVLLSPLRHGLLYAPVRDYAGERNRARPRDGDHALAKPRSDARPLDVDHKA